MIFVTFADAVVMFWCQYSCEPMPLLPPIDETPGLPLNASCGQFAGLGNCAGLRDQLGPSSEGSTPELTGNWCWNTPKDARRMSRGVVPLLNVCESPTTAWCVVTPVVHGPSVPG